MNVAAHEAAHVAAALLLGRAVEEVRVDRPDVNVNGAAVIPSDDETLFTDLVITLVGYTAVPHSLPRGETWPPEWPLDETDGDWGRCYRIVHRGRMTEELYNSAVSVTRKLIETGEFRRLHNLVALALDRVPVLNAAQIKYLVTEETA